MWILDVSLSVLVIASVIFLVYELRKFTTLHARKYEVPTGMIWEKFVGMKPEEIHGEGAESKMAKLEGEIDELKGTLEKQKGLLKKLIEELGR